MSTHTVSVRHNFEAAHRLPHIGGKCGNLHGHSWWAEVTVTSEVLSDTEIVVEFGEYKKSLRRWIDETLDHGAMVGSADPIAGALAEHGCKIFRFGSASTGTTDVPIDASDLTWPTVENVAVLLGRVATAILDRTAKASTATVSRVRVSETSVNAAEWSP